MVEMDKQFFGCQQNLLHLDSQTNAAVEFMCQQSNSLYNCALYEVRQRFIRSGQSYVDNEGVERHKGGTLVNYAFLCKKLKDNKHYQALCAQAAQQTLKGLSEALKSYRELQQKFFKKLISNHPSLPKYRKSGGFHLISFPKQALQFKNGIIVVPLGTLVTTWFGVKNITLELPTNLNYEDIRELQILPRNGCFYAGFVYLQSRPSTTALDTSRVLGIDHGVNNWLTCVTNIGKSFIIDGRIVKSQNQWYNKRVSALKKGKRQDYWDDQLAEVAERRNRQMRDNINKAARFLVNWCLSHNVGTVVFGWNKGNKDGIELGKKNNQEFVQIPTAKLKNRIQQLCQQYGIRFVETEESYTSKASFLDNDFLPIFGEKPESWKPSGKRGKKKDGLGRGQYQTKDGIRINSDCNGAANILKKVSSQLGLSEVEVLAEVRRAVLTLPKRYDLHSMSKSYRQRSEAARIYPAA
jgi:IS605 OrfB family transposase